MALAVVGVVVEADSGCIVDVFFTLSVARFLVDKE